MNVSFATASRTPDTANEDYVLSTPDVVVLLDGAGLPPDVNTGCKHGLLWFVRVLGVRLVDSARDPNTPLARALSAAIEATALAHAGACDPFHPLSPCSTVVALRTTSERVDWLVLSDSTVLVKTQQSLEVVTDQRLKERALPQRMALRQAGGYQALDRWRELVAEERRLRNRPDGYWIAAGEPIAADHALTGSMPITDVVGAVLLSDGAARPVHPFGVTTWERCFEWISTQGPASWIEHVREIDDSDPDRTRWPRSKKHDDATAVLALL